MAIRPDVKLYLSKAKIPYESVSHSQIFTCIDEAKALRINADEVAKNLIIKVKDKYAFAVIPGGRKIDSSKLRHVMGSSHARLATEDEMATDFPEYEVGAVPPLGDLFEVPVYVDSKLLDYEVIIFTAGTHADSIKMKSSDFVNLVNAEMADLVVEPEQKAF